MTKKEAMERPSLLSMFEGILNEHQSLFQDSKNWRQCVYSCHVDWLQPLIKDGLIEETGKRPAWPENELADGREQFYYHDYRVRPKGLKWWTEQYSCQVKNRQDAYRGLIEERSGHQLEGKGIGHELVLDFYRGEGEIAAAGIEDGYFDFVSFYSYSRGMNKRVTVRLTRMGYEYFGSIPRLVLECA